MMIRIILTTAALTVGFAPAHAGEIVSFDDMDANGDGFIIEAEFVAHKTKTGEVAKTDALVAFVAMDADRSGGISEVEWDIAASKHDHDAADEEAGSERL